MKNNSINEFIIRNVHYRETCTGIQPDVRVIPTVKDYLEGKDVVLEAALNYFETKRADTKKSPH